MNELNLQTLELTIRRGAAKGINRATNIVFAGSQRQVPRQLGDLAATGQAPSNSAEHEATEQDLEALVTYGTAYAAAQHEGIALQERASGPVLWVVTQYTTPGTGRHFLLDPLMEMAGNDNFERIVGESVQAELAKTFPVL